MLFSHTFCGAELFLKFCYSRKKHQLFLTLILRNNGVVRICKDIYNKCYCFEVKQNHKRFVQTFLLLHILPNYADASSTLIASQSRLWLHRLLGRTRLFRSPDDMTFAILPISVKLKKTTVKLIGI